METSKNLFKELETAEKLFSDGSIKTAQKKVRNVFNKTKNILSCNLFLSIIEENFCTKDWSDLSEHNNLKKKFQINFYSKLMIIKNLFYEKTKKINYLQRKSFNNFT